MSLISNHPFNTCTLLWKSVFDLKPAFVFVFVDSHQNQFVPFKFSAPESLGAAAAQQSLSAVNLVLSFPGGQTLSNSSVCNQCIISVLVFVFLCFTSVSTDGCIHQDILIQLMGRPLTPPTLHFLPSTVSSSNSWPTWKLISVVLTLVDVLM